MVVGLRIARKREFENCILGGGIESDSDFGKKIFHIKERKGNLLGFFFCRGQEMKTKGMKHNSFYTFYFFS
jgi:hypothetical protein